MLIEFLSKAAGPLFNASAGERRVLDDDVATRLIEAGVCVRVGGKIPPADPENGKEEAPVKQEPESPEPTEETISKNPPRNKRGRGRKRR